MGAEESGVDRSYVAENYAEQARLRALVARFTVTFVTRCFVPLTVHIRT